MWSKLFTTSISVSNFVWRRRAIGSELLLLGSLHRLLVSTSPVFEILFRTLSYVVKTLYNFNFGLQLHLMSSCNWFWTLTTWISSSSVSLYVSSLRNPFFNSKLCGQNSLQLQFWSPTPFDVVVQLVLKSTPTWISSTKPLMNVKALGSLLKLYKRILNRLLLCWNSTKPCPVS